ncbi:hypothetical protein PsorP6_008008 [Peronosclerospora sorghi]|uniref:Uncharacterized protein n=1 Tax=Peronosclerospora sorghi TaxID=230839 RepID=A0ACC0WBM4_9STRA|nr:hypothetical protein PsorP6_008008 [Peronosclerospora sorghi]
MPLFHVIGRTGLNTSFSVCFIFLSGEEIGDYKCSLKEIENLFFGHQIPPPIGLHAIDKHWHLHYVAATPSSPDKSFSSGLELFQKQMDNLARSYVQWTPEQRSIMHAQIADLEAGKTPTVSNPLPVKTKGRPPGAKNKLKSSTKRDPSSLELADRQKKEKDDRKPSVARQRKIQGQKSKLEKALEQNSSKESAYFAKIKGQIHPFLLEYIENVTDVEPDGNCGYRAMTFGVTGQQENWRLLYTDESEFDALVHRVSWLKKEFVLGSTGYKCHKWEKYLPMLTKGRCTSSHFRRIKDRILWHCITLKPSELSKIGGKPNFKQLSCIELVELLVRVTFLFWVWTK